MDIFHLREGSTPLLVSMPHDGIAVPGDVAARMTELGRSVPDTDWHLRKLYAFAAELGASVLRPEHSRYVIDLNRPPDGAPLYPGAPNTGLCPTLSFDGEPLYLHGEEPSDEEIAARRETYWQPYHDALAAQLDRIVEKHGVAVLFEAHSIRAEVPRLFEGRLPDLNLGTNGSASCDPALEASLQEVVGAQVEYSWVVNGRFKGGYITRHYGRPADNVHAVQLEQAQRTYMDESPPFGYREALAKRVQPLLEHLLERMVEWAGERGS